MRNGRRACFSGSKNGTGGYATRGGSGRIKPARVGDPLRRDQRKDRGYDEAARQERDRERREREAENLRRDRVAPPAEEDVVDEVRAQEEDIARDDEGEHGQQRD